MEDWKKKPDSKSYYQFDDLRHKVLTIVKMTKSVSTTIIMMMIIIIVTQFQEKTLKANWFLVRS